MRELVAGGMGRVGGNTGFVGAGVSRGHGKTWVKVRETGRSRGSGRGRAWGWGGETGGRGWGVGFGGIEVGGGVWGGGGEKGRGGGTRGTPMVGAVSG